MKSILKKLVFGALAALAFNAAHAADNDDCRQPDGSSKLGALVDTSFLAPCQNENPAEAVAPAAPAPKAEFDVGVSKPKVGQDYYSAAGKPMRTVFHISDRRDLKSAMAALGNVRNQVSAMRDAGVPMPGQYVSVVYNGDGLSVLREARRQEFDIDGGKLAALVTDLKREGVQMKVCYRTLTGRKLNAKTDLFDVQQADIVPSGVAEVARQQTKFGAAVVKP